MQLRSYNYLLLHSQGQEMKGCEMARKLLEKTWPWPQWILSPRMCPVSQNGICLRCSLPDCFYSGSKWVMGGFQVEFIPLPQSTAEVETPISEGNCSAAAAKCHGHTKLLIYVTQRQHGKQAPGSSVLFQFFSFTFFLRSVTRNDTEPAWRVELNVCGKIVNFKADSGVDVMAISEKKFQSPHSWANCGYSK